MLITANNDAEGKRPHPMLVFCIWYRWDADLHSPCPLRQKWTRALFWGAAWAVVFSEGLLDAEEEEK